MSDFFAIGVPEWHKACSLGLNEAVAFLVLACGTGRDNRTTAWSANAIQKYGGISWVRAKPAIAALIEAGIVQVIGTPTKPRYKLHISEDRIWLPKSIIMPLACEVPPVARIRQVQDVMLLRLYIDLYFSQNLAADGGISRIVFSRGFKKITYCAQGQYVFLGFDTTDTLMTWNPEVVQVHYAAVSQTERQQGKNRTHLFFSRIETLCNLGLLEESAYLFESDDMVAEILFPVDGPTAEEKAVREHIEAAVTILLPDWQIQNNPHKYLVPLYRHQEKAELVGIYRMRHRPRTSATSAWWAGLKTKINDALDFFKMITS